MPIAAANVALPRSASTMLTWVPFTPRPPHPSPMRPSRSRALIGRPLPDEPWEGLPRGGTGRFPRTSFEEGGSWERYAPWFDTRSEQGERRSRGEHHPAGLARAEDVERLADVVEWEAVRDEPVERQPAVPVKVEDRPEVALGT